MDNELKKDINNMFCEFKSEMMALADNERKMNHELIKDLMIELKEAYQLVHSLSEVIKLKVMHEQPLQ